jgi:NADPH:quinone reductase-like Zn-dependent oxidoreductase
MKAAVIHQYGAPEVLQFEEFTDPEASAGQVLVRVKATSVNPIDFKRRSGALKAYFPISFPGIIGVDVAGTIEKVGPDVKDFAVGDNVLCFADKAYAELCVVSTLTLVKLPHGLDLAESAALPLVTTTGYLLISEGVKIKAGQTVLVTGAVGNVGRSAVYAAKVRGARVLAGVRRKQLAAAAMLGADEIIVTDDDAGLSILSPLDAVADTVGGPTAERLLAKLKEGGVYASVVPLPVAERSNVQLVSVQARPDARILQEMSKAVLDRKLSIPIAHRFALKEASKAHTAAEAGNSGKILIVP